MTNLEFNSGAINASDCIGRAWTIVTENLGTYIGATVVAIVILIVSSLIPFANILITAPLLGGIYYLGIRSIDGESADFGLMFQGFSKIGPLLLVSLIQGIPSIILVLLQYTGYLTQLIGLPSMSVGEAEAGALRSLPSIFFIAFFAYLVFSIIWFLIFYFAIPLVMDRDLGAVEAITLSARAGFANAGGIILLIILGVLVMILGLLAICVGLLVAIPVTWVATAVAYRAVFPRLDQAAWQTPPPPTAYGSQFGQGI